MQAPMQPSSSSPRGLQVPSSFGARRSISHDLARFSLDLAPERRRAHNNVPYPSPPMSHSPPPPLNSPSPSDPRHQTSAFYSSAGQMQPSYSSYPYLHEQQQPVQFGVNISLPGDPETYPAPFPPINNSNDRYPPPVISPIGRPPFISQTSFPPPMPPRRPKSHVASACVNCKKAHLACDTRRPCPRCIGLGKQDTCVDVQHKKRGRPRLRDDNRTHSFEIGQMQRPGILSSPSSPSAVPTSYRSSSHRILKSQVDSPRFSRRPSLTPREDILGHHTNGTSYFDQRHAIRPSRINLPPISNATAYLTIDLLVAKSNENMRELLGYTAAELDCQKSLFDIVLNTDVEKVEHLSSRIRDDVRDREPKSWLSVPQLCASIQAVDESQIPSAIPGAISHSDVLHLRRPDGQYLRIRIRAHLAFASVYFVVAQSRHSNLRRS
ncbi:hypothetical protein K440DRAFT_30226 [Wilcoxina mikolae CBS 423.85]|nr:hypothetical protein K440DRAFT_30226 [Wilcoxina mikolae CBS 423.85]